jgi:hypothetical protein
VLHGEVFIEVSNDSKNNGTYALYCLNGLVSSIKEEDFKKVGPITNRRYTVAAGQGLMNANAMSFAEAKATAASNNIKLTKKGDQLVAHLRVGDCFERVPGQLAWKRCSNY